MMTNVKYNNFHGCIIMNSTNTMILYMYRTKGQEQEQINPRGQNFDCN